MPYKDPEKRAEYHREYYRPYMRKVRERDPKKQRESTLAWKLRRQFGLTIDDYWAMLKAQDGRCAICGERETWQRKSRFEKSGKLTFMLGVDHDHQTGKVRALLCRGCNAGLGNFGDSVERMERAIAYLREHKQNL